MLGKALQKYTAAFAGERRNELTSSLSQRHMLSFVHMSRSRSQAEWQTSHIAAFLSRNAALNDSVCFLAREW